MAETRMLNYGCAPEQYAAMVQAQEASSGPIALCRKDTNMRRLLTGETRLASDSILTLPLFPKPSTGL